MILCQNVHSPFVSEAHIVIYNQFFYCEEPFIFIRQDYVRLFSTCTTYPSQTPLNLQETRQES